MAGGQVWQGNVHGRGHAWWGACMVGGMCGRGSVHGRGAYVGGGGVHGRYYEIR